MTEHPFLGSARSFLSHLQVTEHPFLGSARSVLEQLLKLMVLDPSGVVSNYLVAHLLFDLPLGPPNLQVVLPLQPPLALVDPRHSPARDFSFRPLLSSLCLRNLVSLWALVLMEKKVVVASRNRSLLTPICETIKTLLYPLEFYHVYIPVLPHSMWVVFECPTPFLVGAIVVNSIADVVRKCPGDVVVFDLDNDEVLLSKTSKSARGDRPGPLEPVDARAEWAEADEATAAAMRAAARSPPKTPFVTSTTTPGFYGVHLPVRVPKTVANAVAATLRRAAVEEKRPANRSYWAREHLRSPNNLSSSYVLKSVHSPPCTKSKICANSSPV